MYTYQQNQQHDDHENVTQCAENRIKTYDTNLIDPCVWRILFNTHTHTLTHSHTHTHTHKHTRLTWNHFTHGYNPCTSMSFAHHETTITLKSMRDAQCAKSTCAQHTHTTHTHNTHTYPPHPTPLLPPLPTGHTNVSKFSRVTVSRMLMTCNIIRPASHHR